MLCVILPVLSTSQYCIFYLIPCEESQTFRFNESIAGSNTLQENYCLNLPNTVVLILPYILLQYGVKKELVFWKIEIKLLFLYASPY